MPTHSTWCFLFLLLLFLIFQDQFIVLKYPSTCGLPLEFYCVTRIKSLEKNCSTLFQQLTAINSSGNIVFWAQNGNCTCELTTVVTVVSASQIKSQHTEKGLGTQRHLSFWDRVFHLPAARCFCRLTASKSPQISTCPVRGYRITPRWHAFPWVLGIQTQVLKLRCQGLFLLIYFPLSRFVCLFAWFLWFLCFEFSELIYDNASLWYSFVLYITALFLCSPWYPIFSLLLGQHHPFGSPSVFLLK